MGARFGVAAYITVFLLSGTCGVIITKVLFQTTAEGRHGKRHTFEKPWFMDAIMFFAMTFCILWDQIEKSMARRRKAAEKPADCPINADEKQTPLLKLIFLVAIPGLCDFSATYMMNVGMLWLAASIWQMFRGSIVIFTALIRGVFLKKKPLGFEWAGVIAVSIGLCVVGLSGVLAGSDDSQPHPGVGKVLTAFLLVVLAQFIAAGQTVVEEKLLHDVKASSAIVVGFEGLWGFFFCSCVAMPLAQHLPGKDGDGIHEDTIDTFDMIGHSKVILGCLIAYVFVILIFNLFGMYITEVTNSTSRNILESLRTIFIWIAGVILYYSAGDGYGEGLNYWSFMQLGGFLIVLLGLWTYNRVVTFKCFYYPPAEGAPSSQCSLPDSVSPVDKQPLLQGSAASVVG